MGSYGMVYLKGERRMDTAQTCDVKSQTLRRLQQSRQPAKQNDGGQPSDTRQGVLQPSYPIQLCDDLAITLDRISDSMYYLWFDPELVHDMVLIRIQRVCREVQRETGQRIMIDLGYVEDGRIVLRVNLALQAKLERQRKAGAARAMSTLNAGVEPETTKATEIPDAGAGIAAASTKALATYANSGVADVDFCRAVCRIVEIIDTTSDPRERRSFMSDAFDDSGH